MINDSYQKISDDRLMKCNDSSGMIIDSFRRFGFDTCDSFFFLSVKHYLHYSFNVTNGYAFSVGYTNVLFRIQVFRFIYRKFIKIDTIFEKISELREIGF